MPSLISRILRPLNYGSLSVLPEGSAASAASALPDTAQKCTVSAGCFWGVEHLFLKNFGGGKGLLEAKVGYIGGDKDNPSYRSVCSGRSGHAEALQMHFDPAVVSYSTLLEYFYKMHDPTTLNRQGGDTGTQYRSGIFYHSPEQAEIANSVTKKVQKQWWKTRKITTEIMEAGAWWDAEDYHQLYLHNNPEGYECPAHYVRKFPDLTD